MVDRLLSGRDAALQQLLRRRRVRSMASSPSRSSPGVLGRAQASPSSRFTSSQGMTRPAAISSSLSASAAISSLSLRTSSVSSRDSYSADDITTAAGRPFRVMTTCSWTFSISSRSSVRWVRASVNGTVFATSTIVQNYGQVGWPRWTRTTYLRVRSA
jgi:hypothetical protein